MSRRSRSARLAALAVAPLLVLAGCTGGEDPGLLPEADVDVDTPQLRELKRRAGVEDCRPGDAAPVDGGLPELTLACLGGGPDVDLSTLEGPRVVNVWASWCGPCRRELPIYQQFHETYGDRVAVLGIDWQDTQPQKALELVRDTGVTYPLLADPSGELSGAGPFPNLAGLPFLALVDADGVVVHREYVEIESLDQLVDLAREHLGLAS